MQHLGQTKLSYFHRFLSFSSDPAGQCKKLINPTSDLSIYVRIMIKLSIVSELLTLDEW